jgi:hypothetical protein
MADATVAADFLKTLDVLPYPTAKVSLHLVVPVYVLPKLTHFGLN